jgi:hypothetical protein
MPSIAVNEIIPLGNQVVYGTARGHSFDQPAGVAKRHSAIHAARSLLTQAPFWHVLMELSPVVNPHGLRTIDR